MDRIERDRILEDERMDILTKQTNLRVEHFKEQIALNKSMTDQLREKVNECVEKLKASNENVRAWYDEYLGRTIHANKLIIEEIDRVRGLVISAES